MVMIEVEVELIVLYVGGLEWMKHGIDVRGRSKDE